MKNAVWILKLALLVIGTGVIQSCSKDTIHPEKYSSLDIILIIGQSNTYAGFGYDPELDKEDPLIYQLGRYGKNNMIVIQAKEPLEHHTVVKNRIGFALPFAKIYKSETSPGNRKVLIIPCGFGGSGFSNSHWNDGDDQFEDAISRTNYILNNFDDTRLAAILWHQGEADIGFVDYQHSLDSMIINMRKKINASYADSIPFILGGMVPKWVSNSSERQKHQEIIKNTTKRINYTGYADPTRPTIIKKILELSNTKHYDAIGQRELGRRYYNEYKRLTRN